MAAPYLLFGGLCGSPYMRSDKNRGLKMHRFPHSKYDTNSLLSYIWLSQASRQIFYSLKYKDGHPQELYTNKQMFSSNNFLSRILKIIYTDHTTNEEAFIKRIQEAIKSHKTNIGQ